MLRRTFMARCVGSAALAAAEACSWRNRQRGMEELLVLASRTVLRIVLGIIGVSAPEQM